MKNLASLSQLERETFMTSLDTFIFDIDGVLWLGGKPIEGAAEVIDGLYTAKKQVIFFSNACYNSRRDFVKVMKAFCPLVKEDDIVSSSFIMADYLKRIGFNGKAYLIGTDGLKEELDLAGIETFGAGEGPKINTFADIHTLMDGEEDVAAVILGLDFHFSSAKLIKAINYLKNPSCRFFATHPDAVSVGFKSMLLPGVGATAAAIEKCTGRRPLIVGKPEAPSIQALLSKGIDPQRSIVIGDSLETDIEAGNKLGARTLLALTGVSSLSQVPPDSQPTYYASSVAELKALIHTN